MTTCSRDFEDHLQSSILKWLEPCSMHLVIQRDRSYEGIYLAARWPVGLSCSKRMGAKASLSQSVRWNNDANYFRSNLEMSPMENSSPPTVTISPSPSYHNEYIWFSCPISSRHFCSGSRRMWLVTESGGSDKSWSLFFVPLQQRLWIQRLWKFYPAHLCF